MKLTAKPLALIIFVVLFGGISFSSLMGWWQTKNSKQPQRFGEGRAAGEYNPADIRGSYTFGDIANLFEIPLEELGQAFRVPAGTDLASYGVKSLEAQFAGETVEIGTGSLRLFVAFYTGLPYTPAEEYLPAEAVAILKAKAPLTPERLAYLEAHTLEGEAALPEPAVGVTPAAVGGNGQGEPAGEGQNRTERTPVEGEHLQPDRTITGQTTFQQLLDWGVTVEQIEAVLGAKLPDPATVIRAYFQGSGGEFGIQKVKLQELVDGVD
jgi:hypothetical protein